MTLRTDRIWRTLTSGRLLPLRATAGLFIACGSERDAPLQDELRAVLAALDHIEAMGFRYQQSDTLRGFTWPARARNVGLRIRSISGRVRFR